MFQTSVQEVGVSVFEITVDCREQESSLYYKIKLSESNKVTIRRYIHPTQNLLVK